MDETLIALNITVSITLLVGIIFSAGILRGDLRRLQSDVVEIKTSIKAEVALTTILTGRVVLLEERVQRLLEGME